MGNSSYSSAQVFAKALALLLHHSCCRLLQSTLGTRHYSPPYSPRGFRPNARPSLPSPISSP